MKIKPPSFGKVSVCCLLICVLISLVLLSSKEKRYFEVDIGDITISAYSKEAPTSVEPSQSSDFSSSSTNVIKTSSNENTKTSNTITINSTTTLTSTISSSSKKSETPLPPKSNLPAEIVYKASTDKFTENIYVNASGKKEENVGMVHTSLIPVETSVTYFFKHYTSYSMYAAVVLYDSNKKAIKGYHPKHIKQLEKSYCYAADTFCADNYEKECNWITIPDGVSYIGFNVPKSQIQSFEVYKNNWTGTFHTYESNISSNNNLSQKSALFFGDSIAAGQTAGNEGFPEHIAGANNMIYRSYAVPGYKLSNFVKQFNSSNSTLKSLTANDYVIVEGFVNDVIGTYNPLPIGNLSEKGSTNFDDTTFTGMLEKLIYDYQQAGYKGKLGFVLTPKPTRNANSHSLIRDYWDAAIAVFKKYDVEYLDLWDEKVAYSDGLHPNHEGQFTLTQKIETWMNTF